MVASPVDVGGDLPSPYEGATGKDPEKASNNPNREPNWWDTFKNIWGSLRGWIQVVAVVLGLIAIALLLGVFTPIFRPLLNLLGKLFSGILSLFRGVGSTAKNLFEFGDRRYTARRQRKKDKQSDEDRDFANAEKKYDSERKRVNDIREDHSKQYDFQRRKTLDSRADERYKREEKARKEKEKEAKRKEKENRRKAKEDQEKRKRAEQATRDTLKTSATQEGEPK